ncbi:MAG: hypothetical protein ACI4OJ_07730 [Lachnospiraceae bacterium]
MQKNSALTGRLTYSLLIILFYILGRNIRLPWLIPQEETSDILSMQYYISQMLGSARKSSSLFALGLSPWMSASIIASLIQSVTWRPGTRAGQDPAQTNRISILLTLLFAIVQALVRCQSASFQVIPGMSQALLMFLTLLLWVTGSLITVWLSGQNATWGIGGKSLLVLVNLVFSINQAIVSEAVSLREAVKAGSSAAALQSLALILGITALSLLVPTFLKFSEIRLPVVRVMISHQYEGESYIPISLNPSGTFPAMYTMSLYSIPYYVLMFLGTLQPGKKDTYTALAQRFDLQSIPSVVCYLIVFCFLTFFLSLILVNPAKMADALEKSGDYIDGYRPGRETKHCIKRAVIAASVFSCIGMGLVTVGPLFLRVLLHVRSQIFMMPVTIAILVNLLLEIFEELRVEWRLEHMDQAPMKSPGGLL